MNKKLLIILAVILVIIIAVVLYLLLSNKGESNITPIDNKIAIEDACIASGGTVATAPCCSSAREFPNTCMVGACGCSPDNSQETKTCTCPEGACFDGSACARIPVEESSVTPVE